MKNAEYYKSGKHLANVEFARKQAIESCKRKKQQRIKEYNENPSKCTYCDSALSYDKRKNKFCGSSCSATYNNTGRVASQEKKEKISKSLKGKPKTRIGYGKLYCNVFLKQCSCCENKFYVNNIKHSRKTCSKRCATILITQFRTYQNGSRKAVWFYNPYENKKVLLESSWEVRTANKLIELDIEWVRPDPLDWIDSAGKPRLYYPDFYLPKFNIYLDPKNPYCMKKDVEKMNCISKKVSVVYGDIQKVLGYIQSL